MKRFRIIIECQTPEGSDDNRAHAYASNVRDYVRGPLFVAGIGYHLGVHSVEYRFHQCSHRYVDESGRCLACEESTTGVNTA